MAKIFNYLVAALLLGFQAGIVYAEATDRVFRDDCHLSFIAPDGLEYVEVDNQIATGDDVCYMAFKYTGALKLKSVGNPPAMPEDWRMLTDFAITIKRSSLSESIDEIESPGGGGQYGVFGLKLKSHIKIKGGDLYIFSFFAKNPTSTMIRLRQVKETIFVAGNDKYSASYLLYSGEKLVWREKARDEALRSLFSSFEFY
ncbi:hypothetical protein [Burkholderia ubonensis]|uniref:hypothetical protein n=1 Tax=Burkholderia ubonensis TaxID=101571 RepID=UPI000A71E9E1|nr:hypothetical protein [Burkholderia ubonensis]